MIIIIVGVLLFLFFSISYVIGYLLGSRRYTFYRDWIDVNFTVTRYLLGLIPIHKKTYKGLKNIEIENYIETDEGRRYDRARIYAYLKSGKTVELKKLTVYNREKEIREIATNIETLLHSRQQDALIIHNCRMQSLLAGILGYTLGTSSLLVLLFPLGAIGLDFFAPSIETYLSKQEWPADSEHRKESEVYSAPPDYSASDLPSTFPIIDDTVITQIQFKNENNTWEVWLDANNYEPIKLHQGIKQAVHDKGWQTSRTEVFPSYDSDGNAKPDSGYIFYLRNAEHTLEGDVIITEGINGLVGIISVPVPVPMPPSTDQPTS